MSLQELVERAMSRAEGAQATSSESESSTVSFESDRLKSVRSAQSTAISVRVVVDGKLGVSRTNDPDDREGVVERALEAAEFGSPVHFSFPGPAPLPAVKVRDEAVPSVTPAEMVTLGEGMIAKVKEYSADILLGAGVGRSVSRHHLANSAGANLSEESTSFSLGLHGQRVRGTDILWVGHGLSAKKRALDERFVTSRTIELFRMAEKIVPIGTGDMPVIFSPAGMGVLLLALRLGFNGKNVVLGSSPLAGKLGEKIADERLSITDDPLVDFADGSSAYDGEGVSHRVTPLIEEGVVKNFLYDLDTAGRADAESTGNGIGCGSTNVVVGEGKTPYDEMIRSTKEGLIIHDVIGLGQGNPLSGEFSVNVNLGYKIENGEIVGRVKNVMLAGNTYEAIRRIDAIGDRAEWAGGRLLTPPVKVSSLSVVASET
jgi:PmbA protein